MMNQTKITLKIHEPLLRAFNRKVESNFLKRDAFLNHMIKSEVNHLEHELEGLRQTNEARLYISREIKSLELKIINVVVDKETAESLKKVVEKTNMVRDAFANRLILFLLSPDELLEYLELPIVTTEGVLQFSEGMPISPLGGIESILADPMFYIRQAAQEQYAGKFYRLPLNDKFIGLSCYLSDKYVPNTPEYKAENEHLEAMLGFLDDGKQISRTKGDEQ